MQIASWLSRLSTISQRSTPRQRQRSSANDLSESSPCSRCVFFILGYWCVLRGSGISPSNTTRVNASSISSSATHSKERQYCEYGPKSTANLSGKHLHLSVYITRNSAVADRPRAHHVAGNFAQSLKITHGHSFLFVLFTIRIGTNDHVSILYYL